jgi:DNA repair protein RadC
MPDRSRQADLPSASTGPAGFIIVHNHHLSGCAEPSRADIEATKKLRRLSGELGVPLLDHFIVAGKGIVRI